ncbi:hypothetical protein [Corynebacterium urinipleomorphum]|uniref:hypothetical protein n=1 Tax=Corynebacterium urinipleomorphum TaxID=1852380 RepID=UPI000B35950C|nr:hypothetical protein [Corynebacterium urinipleomorphum]
MTHVHRAHRVAVVGAGAAGIHASDALICMPGTSHSYFVDLFDAAPAPTGVIRFAAEHREAPGSFVDAFSASPAAFVPRLRLFGNVRVGTDVTIGELTHYYDTVVVAGTDGSLTVVGTSAEAGEVYETLSATPSLAVGRTPVVTEPSAADQPGAIVALLESRAIPFTTWRGWHRPAWADRSTVRSTARSAAATQNPRNYAAHSSAEVPGEAWEDGGIVSVDKWNAIVAGGLAVPAVP